MFAHVCVRVVERRFGSTQVVWDDLRTCGSMLLDPHESMPRNMPIEVCKCLRTFAEASTRVFLVLGSFGVILNDLKVCRWTHMQLWNVTCVSMLAHVYACLRMRRLTSPGVTSGHLESLAVIQGCVIKFK